MHLHINNASSNIADIVGGLHREVTGIKPTKLCLCCKTMKVVMEWQKKNFQLLEYYSILNNHGLMKYWNSCFTKFTKFTYLR